MMDYEFTLLAARIADILRPLKESERTIVLAIVPFCRHCGCDDPDGECQCCNDE